MGDDRSESDESVQGVSVTHPVRCACIGTTSAKTQPFSSTCSRGSSGGVVDRCSIDPHAAVNI
jgi:hypothetical protein